MTLGVAGVVCPVCGRLAMSTHVRLERVSHDTRDYGWAKWIKTFVHDDSCEHRIPLGPVFEVKR